MVNHTEICECMAKLVSECQVNYIILKCKYIYKLIDSLIQAIHNLHCSFSAVKSRQNEIRRERRNFLLLSLSLEIIPREISEGVPEILSHHFYAKGLIAFIDQKTRSCYHATILKSILNHMIRG